MVMVQTVSITWCFFFTGNTGFPLGQHERTGRTGGQTGGPGQTDCRMAGPGQKDSSGGRAALGWSRWTGVLSESAGLTRT